MHKLTKITALSQGARETACLEVNIRSYYLRPPSWILPAWEHGLEFEIGTQAQGQRRRGTKAQRRSDEAQLIQRFSRAGEIQDGGRRDRFVDLETS